MTEVFLYTSIALIASSLGSVGLAGLLLTLRNNYLLKVSTYLTYLAGGTLLGAAFLGMIPKAIELSDVEQTTQIILSGLVGFFLLEKIILWRTCQNKECERHLKAAAPMILIGDAFHNAIDGVVIAASFLTSAELGIFASVSIVFHEIPQELADFGILINSGMSKRKALFYNALSGSSAIAFGLLAYFFMGALQWLIPLALAVSASSFLYIALADLIPEMHRKTSLSDSATQLLLILVGIALIWFIINHRH